MSYWAYFVPWAMQQLCQKACPVAHSTQGPCSPSPRGLCKCVSVSTSDRVMRDECCSNKPSRELQAFFRRHFSNVTFIQGSVLDITALKLAKVCVLRAHCPLFNAPHSLVAVNRCKF